VRSSRRTFLKNGCYACVASLFPSLLWSEVPRSNAVVDLKGDLRINGKPAVIGQPLREGDTLITGIASKATIFFNGDAYHLKENTKFALPIDTTSFFKIFSGAVLGAFAPNKPKTIQIGEKTVLSIRGTGACFELGAERSDVCLCYGHAFLSSNKSEYEIVTDTKFHKDFTILSDGEIRPTHWHERRPSHTSRQNIELERIAGRASPFDGGYRDWISKFQSTEL
jgi:hypothetical protein